MSAIDTASLCHVFGVRHLSPMGAWQLRQFLDQMQPQVVLIEGPCDAEGLLDDVVRKGTVPPIGILAFSNSVPVRTFVYPLARYSPEYQAILWAKENKADCEFIDLPSDIFLGLQEREHRRIAEAIIASKKDAQPAAASPEPAASDASDDPAVGEPAIEPIVSRGSLYQQLAALAGEEHYESYWERNFEHNTCLDSYRKTSMEFGRNLREIESDTAADAAENLVREAFMRRQIRAAIDRGVAPDKIVAIVGAYHAPVLSAEFPPMSDQELEQLPRLESNLTLMPYSYFRLSSQSGYGAGNEAPAYFELLWDALSARELSHLPARYLSMVVRHQRDAGTHRSTAEVIEAVRLANSLSALKAGMAPTLNDLRDAAVTLIGHGQRSTVAESLAQVDVGTAIGSLPEGVSQTSIQADFNQQLTALKLVKYRTAVRQVLSIDLRENRRAKTAAAAFLDLHRSSFLHRLHLLEINFASPVASRQQASTWSEKWELQWTPESEITLVESVLLGETIELAAGFKFKTLLDEATTVAQAASAVAIACRCGMMEAMDQARGRLQALAAESSDFTAVAGAAAELASLVKYGDVRQFDAAPLRPLIETLFVQGALALMSVANCDNDAARDLIASIDALNRVALEFHDLVDEPLWIVELHGLSDSDDRNPLLSGYACAMLLERDQIDNARLAREVSRRLSPGAPADLGAGWFEGLSRRNRYALLARQPLWQQLADYVESLDDEQFRRALVFLRRAFGEFSPQEKQSIAENLGQHWGVDQDLASEVLKQPLSESESEALDELNDFDFGEF
ncbi:hypothetical protein EC9_45360 [Rosistilla ulvae]|uniref:Uncharacterized protein n=1 Tax=Rosistilla ulvae TaxID=1930277 RepID=A0A517M634_9BACT|nr:DUF5682 family protein [Rosistilla ulvae]QDS90328.1 hypothetical protein EC9_45360 [Rosistilla ulvae]